MAADILAAAEKSYAFFNNLIENTNVSKTKITTSPIKNTKEKLQNKMEFANSLLQNNKFDWLNFVKCTIGPILVTITLMQTTQLTSVIKIIIALMCMAHTALVFTTHFPE